MLRLYRGQRPAIAVPLPGGAVILIRAATAFEIDKAAAGAAYLLAGLVGNQEAAEKIADMLGDEYLPPEGAASKAWAEAAGQRLALLELADLCAAEWKGVCDLDGKELTGKPDKGMLALLLRDVECARRIGEAIKGRVHDEIKEGKGSPASQDGAAAAGDPTAPNASGSDRLVLTGDPATAGSAAPK